MAIIRGKNDDRFAHTFKFFRCAYSVDKILKIAQKLDAQQSQL